MNTSKPLLMLLIIEGDVIDFGKVQVSVPQGNDVLSVPADVVELAREGEFLCFQCDVDVFAGPATCSHIQACRVVLAGAIAGLLAPS